MVHIFLVMMTAAYSPPDYPVARACGRALRRPFGAFLMCHGVLNPSKAPAWVRDRTPGVLTDLLRRLHRVLFSWQLECDGTTADARQGTEADGKDQRAPGRHGSNCNLGSAPLTGPQLPQHRQLTARRAQNEFSKFRDSDTDNGCCRGPGARTCSSTGIRRLHAIFPFVRSAVLNSSGPATTHGQTSTIYWQRRPQSISDAFLTLDQPQSVCDSR